MAPSLRSGYSLRTLGHLKCVETLDSVSNYYLMQEVAQDDTSVKGEELEDGENSGIIKDTCSLSNMGHDVID